MRAQIDIGFQFNLNSATDSEGLVFADQNNVSNAEEMFDETNYSYKGFKGFNFAGVKDEWPAVSDGTYSYYPDEGYKGYMSQSLSAADGSTNIALQLRIIGEIPNTLFVMFDGICNEYATELVVSNNQNSNTIAVNNRNYIVMIPLTDLNLEAGDNVLLTIQINKWNKPFKNIKVTQLSFTYMGIYTEHDLINFECSENLLNQQLTIEAGICEQYADIRIYDRSGILHEFALQEILIADQNVTITIIDDTNNTSYVLGTFVVNKWNVESTSSEIGIECKDITLTFNNIYVAAVEVADRSVDDMLEIVFSQVKGVEWRYIDTDTEEYCKSIVTPNSWFYTDTLLETLIKICLLGQIRVYWYIDSFIIARCY